MGMSKLRQARNENRLVREVNEFLKTEFKLDLDFARDHSVERAWRNEFAVIIKQTKTVEQKSIGRTNKNEIPVYSIMVEFCSYGDYWEQDEVDYKELTQEYEDDFLGALFAAFAEVKKELFRHDTEPVFEELPEQGNLCRGCFEPSEYQYCQTCCDAGKADCSHGNKPGECGACDHDADLAFTASRERC